MIWYNAWAVDDLEEPAECRDCGLWTEAENIHTAIIDQISGDTETFCPRCGSDYIIFHRPREDRK